MNNEKLALEQEYRSWEYTEKNTQSETSRHPDGRKGCPREETTSMNTITQQEFLDDLDAYCQFVEDYHERICIVSDDGKKVVLMDFNSYQLLANKKITISGDEVIEEPLSDSDRTKILDMLQKKDSADK